MDYDKLRGDLRDYYGTAMFNGNPMAMMELEEGRAMTLTDIMSCCDEVSDMSNQRVSALVRQLVTDGRVERFEEKRLAYFRAYEA